MNTPIIKSIMVVNALSYPIVASFVFLRNVHSLVSHSTLKNHGI